MWWKWKLCGKFISLEWSPLGSLSDWLVSWASVGTDPPEVCWAIVSGLTGPRNLEQLILVLVLVVDHRTPGTSQIAINGGAFAESHSWFLLSLSVSPSLLSPHSVSFTFLCMLEFFFFESSVFYDLSPFLPKFIQCVFWLFHLPLRASGGQSVLRRSNFWGIQCSICLTNIHFLLSHWHNFRRRNVYPTLPHW